MELSQILNNKIPNAGPQARASIAEAERRLAMLNETDPKRAQILRDQVIKQISSRDEGITNTLADIGKLHGLSLRQVEPQDKASEDQSNIARSIEQLVSVADSRNIAIPPAILYAASEAFVSRDQGAVAALANSIGRFVDAGIKVQQDEDKIQTSLSDGTSVLIGRQSGTRYDNTATPIPFGNNNSQLFASLASHAYSPQSREMMAAMQKQLDIVASPEAYAANQAPNLTSTELKEKDFAEARSLYKSGDRIGSLNKLRALEAKDIFGDITDITLDDYFGVSSSNTSSPSNPPPVKKSINEIIK